MRETALHRSTMHTALVFAVATATYIALQNSNVVVSALPGHSRYLRVSGRFSIPTSTCYIPSTYISGSGP
jgi:hypothetical protein